MKSLYEYVSKNCPEYILDKNEKARLLELDKEYGEFFREF